MNGLQGGIDMPNAEMLPNSTITYGFSYLPGTLRNSVSAQISPRISASFKYSGIGDKDIFALGFGTWDRSFDIKVLLLKETEYLPSISIGLNDFIGTGISSGEYIVSTKNIGNYKISGGIGFGRLATHGAIENPIRALSSRGSRNDGTGGSLESAQWFQGDIAPFLSLSWKINPKLTGIIEYSSDNYDRIQRFFTNGFEYESPVNLGVRYQLAKDFSIGGYWIGGEHFGMSAHFELNTSDMDFGSGIDPAPVPIRHRVLSDQNQYIASDIPRMSEIMKIDGFEILDVTESDEQIEIKVENLKYRSPSQAIGRLLRSASRYLRNDIEIIKIYFIEKGMVVSTISIDRSSLEQLDGQVNGSEKLVKAITFEDGLSNHKNSENQGFNWSLSPYLQYTLFDPLDPVKFVAGAKLSTEYQFSSTLMANSIVRKPIYNSF